MILKEIILFVLSYLLHLPSINHGGVYTYHLGERLNGIQEVSGSIPLISTKQLWDEHSHLDTTRGCFRFVLSNAHICRLNLKIPRREICGGFLLSWLLCAKIL